MDCFSMLINSEIETDLDLREFFPQFINAYEELIG